MNIHDATEQAYRNGYKKGVEDIVIKIKRKASLGSVPINLIDCIKEELLHSKQ